MGYKLHSIFTSDAKRIIDERLPSIKDEIRHGLLMDMIFISRMGVLPEGESAEDIALTESPKPVPIPPPPLVTGIKEYTSKFNLGVVSKDRLGPVHPRLRSCVELAIRYSTVDFRVQQGLRTIEEQKKAVASGHSRTMHSKHLRQADGFVWAVDLVALRNNIVTWDFDTYAYIAFAMDKAATELGIAGHIRWGCAWDKVLSDYGGSPQAYLNEASAYAKRHVGSDLLDAPHFEWVP